ncbi:MAG: phosphoribosylformimino-5-aminoimidazole carboxamide ribotide isomerase [Firmicutes bacterium HGW-Firmicutes-1]|jgi:phosphoribosylformimino-5-aminoimidazole carboxamide ribotide isomerase|nr:MAG: phosphoribosylformimino-5-aminoimidazole carboxamide ribotide isomerase [Firmicutes bacterium HGW-Firmicutes-1]
MFRPCIDLHNGQVKQIVGGTLTDSGQGMIENFVSEKDSTYYANLFKADGLKGGHVIMLGSGNEKAATEALQAYPNGLQVGGGINPENASIYLEKGASHVIVTSYVFNNGQIVFEHLEKMVKAISKEKLVLDLSCRQKSGKYYVVTDRWQKFTEYEVNQEHLRLLESYCDEFLIHGVDVEGKQQGIALQLVEDISKWIQIPVTYAGGIRSFEDIKTINRIGQGRVHYTIGSALDIFGGQMSYREVVNNQEN